MIRIKKTVPVYLSGMWPSQPSQPESGTRIGVIEKEGGPILLHGFSDTTGEFKDQLPIYWVGKKIQLVIREPGFKYDYFNPVQVERYGLFLAIRQEKDPIYSGSKGAKTINFKKWIEWNSTQEHIKASKKISAAIRKAKIAWPLQLIGLIITAILGVLGFFIHPIVGFVISILLFFATEKFSQYLLNHGY